MRITPLLCSALLAVTGCSKSEPSHEQQAAHVPAAKDPEAAKKLISNGAVVIDVRTPEEFADGHLPTATNIPVQDVPARLADVSKLVGGDKSKPVVVYCGTGNRAGKAKTALEGAGFTNVVNGGGYDDLTTNTTP